ncbi:MAG TPA: phosphatase PAP2 family protein [Candidatus Dormibacteraeota bacterium]|nr:phosphatase PAP2 family protein [Candidatus Dormibacteraeota bacterium]
MRGVERETREIAVPIPWRGAAPTGIAPREVEGTPLAAVPAQQLIAARIGRELVAAWSACGAFEWMGLGYLAISAALVMSFHKHLKNPLSLLALQASVATIILLLCAGYAKSEARAQKLGGTWASRMWHFWRHWYPHLFFLFCFEELGHLVHLVYPGWFDGRLLAADYWLTGVYPTVWLEQFTRPALNEFMQFAYLTYFLYLVVLGGFLYARKDFRGYWAVMTYSAVAYSIGYVIAIFFPIESPWFSMAGAWHGELRGGFFTSLINWIERFGRVRGAAFPSEHVAGAMAALWGARRHLRWLYWVYAPLVVCMMASTIYGRYHYVADIFGGMVTGTAGYWLGKKLMERRGAVAGISGRCAKLSDVSVRRHRRQGNRHCSMTNVTRRLT